MENRALFLAIVSGIILVIPTAYIPGLNDKVFQQGPFDWEWILIFAGQVLFIAIAEMYKALERKRSTPQKSVYPNTPTV